MAQMTGPVNARFSAGPPTGLVTSYGGLAIRTCKFGLLGPVLSVARDSVSLLGHYLSINAAVPIE